MATKSITRTVNIKSASSCKKLLYALESSAAREPKLEPTKSVEYVRRDDIRKMFGAK